MKKITLVLMTIILGSACFAYEFKDLNGVWIKAASKAEAEKLYKETSFFNNEYMIIDTEQNKKVLGHIKNSSGLWHNIKKIDRDGQNVLQLYGKRSQLFEGYDPRDPKYEDDTGDLFYRIEFIKTDGIKVEHYDDYFTVEDSSPLCQYSCRVNL